MASKDKLECVIKDIKQDGRAGGRLIVSVQFDDGDSAGPWYQAFAILPTQVVTVNDFAKLLLQQKIQRPENPAQELERLMEAGEKFELDMTGIIHDKPAE